jgi:hypothetical protein
VARWMAQAETDAKRQANAEAQARWRERHVDGVDGEKERLQLVLVIGTKARLRRIAEHYGYPSITALLESWATQTASDIDDAAERAAREKIIADYKGKYITPQGGRRSPKRY